MDKSGRDKSYFKPPEGSPPLEVRSLFAKLINVALNDEVSKYSTTLIRRALVQRERDIADLLAQLRGHPWYQQSDSLFPQKLEADLKRVSAYWEEEWRLDEAWPLIKDVLNRRL